MGEVTIKLTLAEAVNHRLTDLLAEAYDQACRQCRDMLALRSGPVGERLRRLLMLLGAAICLAAISLARRALR